MQVKIWNRSMNAAEANCRSNSPSRPYREPLFHAFHADKIPRRSNTRASGLCTNMLSTSDHMILKFIYFIIAIFILIYHFLTTWTAIKIITKILFHQILVSTKRVSVTQSVCLSVWGEEGILPRRNIPTRQAEALVGKEYVTSLNAWFFTAYP